MDPNAALERCRALAQEVLDSTPAEREDNLSDVGVELAEAFFDLDRWLKNRGFLPKAWDHGRNYRPGEENARPGMQGSPDRMLPGRKGELPRKPPGTR
jgi:hypothetical protein